MDQRYDQFYSRIPKSIRRTTTIPPAAKLVYLAMLDYSRKGGICFASHERIATETGLNRTSVWRSLQDLIKHNYVEMIELNGEKVTMKGGDHKGRTNAYRCLVLIKPRKARVIPIRKHAS